ncbi:PAS domain-containing protein [Patulibacter brassicae]|uniref:PAS domain-containing protein n=1 Tax=Patulibacter brassicae TaxID=1705717 RepID=A0ABU4VL28_9ACTN|nr:PAS domain-containing protein [Patulibacter brassicae]MDX8152384.1 PAS domain-containing protein [Patulibacter brassicae]
MSMPPDPEYVRLAEMRAAMDALEDHVTLVDHDGRVLHVNAAWRAFARRNAWTGVEWEGADYLAVCDVGDPDARAVADGLRAVLEGRRREFEIEYACHAPDELRWFSLRIAGLPRATGAAAVLNHRDVTEEHLDRLERDRSGEADPAEAVDARAHGRDALQERAEQLAVLDRTVGALLLELPTDALAGTGEGHVREALGVLEQLFLPPNVTGRWSDHRLLVLLPGLDGEQLTRAARTSGDALRIRLPHAIVDRLVIRGGHLRTDLSADEALRRLAHELPAWRPAAGAPVPAAPSPAVAARPPAVT